MRSFQIGDTIPHDVDLVRRLNPEWIEEDYISIEAYRPRKLKGKLENVSVEVEEMITIPFQSDQFASRTPPWSAGRIISNVPDGLGYPVVFNKGSSGAHAELTGNMEFLFQPDGDLHLQEMTEATVIFYP